MAYPSGAHDFIPVVVGFVLLNQVLKMRYNKVCSAKTANFKQKNK